MSVLKPILKPFKEAAEHLDHYVESEQIARPIQWNRRFNEQKQPVFNFFSTYKSLDDVRQQFKSPFVSAIGTLHVGLWRAVSCLVSILKAAIHFAFLFDLQNAKSSIKEAWENFTAVVGTAVVGPIYVATAAITLVTRTLTSLVSGLYHLPGAIAKCCSGKGGKGPNREEQHVDQGEREEGDFRMGSCLN